MLEAPLRRPTEPGRAQGSRHGSARHRAARAGRHRPPAEPGRDSRLPASPSFEAAYKPAGALNLSPARGQAGSDEVLSAVPGLAPHEGHPGTAS